MAYHLLLWYHIDMGNNFHQERNVKNTLRIKELLGQLPDFCYDYFVAIETKTSPLTRLNYAYDLLVFFDFVVQGVPSIIGKSVMNIDVDDMKRITASHIERYMSYLSYYNYNGEYHSCNECAKSRKLSSVRSLFRFLFERDWIPSNVTTKVKSPKIHQKEIIKLDKTEVTDILDVTTAYKPFASDNQNTYHDNDFFKVRDLAILTLFLGTGIRVSELVGLNVDDVSFKTKSFVVTRKGGNRSVLYFSDEVKSVIELWLPIRELRLKQAGKHTESALFISSREKRISIRAVEVLVKKFAKIVSPQKKITPHKLRSTYGTALYDATKDIYVVAEVLGHKDINTTKKHYASMSDDIKKAASTAVVLTDDTDNKN